MGIEQDEVARVNASYKRLLAKPEFFDTFYKHFTAKGPRIVEKFKGTDMKRQMDALKHGLQYMIMFTTGSKIASSKIEDLAGTHDRNHRDISPDMYDAWVESFVEALKEYDPEYTDDLARDWKSVLGHGIRRMKAVY